MRITRTPLNSKIRAILAGGLVLGIGAAASVAAWNDSQNGSSTLTTGGYSLESVSVVPGSSAGT